MKKRTLKKILTGFSIIVFVLSVGLFSIVIMSRVKGEIPGVFGYSFHIVITDSMTPEIGVDDMVISRVTSVNEIKIGDDVVFVTPDPDLDGITIVHRVVGINEDGSLVTQGIKKGATKDEYPVYNIKGRVVSVSPFLGKLFKGMEKNRNIVFGIAIGLIFIVIIDEAVFLIKEISKKKTESDSENKD